MSTDYVITVRGHLDDQWSAWFEGMTITNSANGESLLAYDLTETAGNVLYLLATFSGPTVAALIVTGMTEGGADIKRLLKRCVQ